LRRGCAWFRAAAALTFALIAGVVAVPAAPGPAPSDLEAARYAVTPGHPTTAGETAPEYQAENPANHLRFTFPATGVVGNGEPVGLNPWRFDLRLAGVSFDGRSVPVDPPRVEGSGNRVDYDFRTVRVSYINTPSGLEQRSSIAAPGRRGRAGAPATIVLDFSVDGGLKLAKSGYYLDLTDAAGAVVLRFGPVEAKGAQGAPLSAHLEVGADTAGARVIIEASAAQYPIDVSASVMSAAPAPRSASIELVSRPVAVTSGIIETVSRIMERDRLTPPYLLGFPRETHNEIDVEIELEPNPSAPPPMSHWPPIPEAPSALVVGPPNLPQTVGTSFKGVGYSESFYFPPDSMGDVGPTQILTHVNGRIKVFDKAGTVGFLNADPNAFWASQHPRAYTGDSQVRYDRLSGRWFVMTVDFLKPDNLVMLAVSSGPTIDLSTYFTFYSFLIDVANPAEGSYWCDYPSMGVDANAVYIGCNMYTVAGVYQYSSAFVIRKSSVTGPGPMVVTGITGIAAPGVGGPFSPRGVDNDDPSWSEGYFVGPEPGSLSSLSIRRISDPGGTPALGPIISLPVSNTALLDQPALGSTVGVNVLGLRLYSASIHKNKISGVTSLWTAHNVETDATCTPSSGSDLRLGAKWYEIGSLTTTPTITQFGTLCNTTTSGSMANNSQRGFLYPAVVETGQGHMALASSYASATEYVGVAAAGRLRTDPPAGTRAPETIVQTGLASYTINDSALRNRWGDYSFTDVDPTDDQTVWTIQEYADTPSNNWAVRVVQLKAPPPPTTASAGSPVCVGVAAAPVSLTGADSCAAPSCTNGLCSGGGSCPEFFDPGPDTGGPGYPNHLTATATGGVTVNSVALVLPANPATQRVRTVSLSLNTTAAATGAKSVTITNPDGQSRTYTNVISVIANRAPVANTGGSYASCQGGPVFLNGTGSTDPDAACGDSIVSYEWDLNNDATFDVTGATPTVSWAQLTALGLGVGSHTIKLRVTDTHGAVGTTSGTLTILSDGSSCTDSNACTLNDSCQAGACVGSSTVSCSASDACHVAGVCDSGTGVCSNPNAPDGTPCIDGNDCTSDDVCASGACAGTPVLGPPEVGNNVQVSRAGSDAILVWSPSTGANSSSVSRGRLDALPVGSSPGTETCLASRVAVPTASATDIDVPAPGSGFWYLVRGENACGAGSYGHQGQNGVPTVPEVSAACP
jgi:hypothetical protein